MNTDAVVDGSQAKIYRLCSKRNESRKSNLHCLCTVPAILVVTFNPYFSQLAGRQSD